MNGTTVGMMYVLRRAFRCSESDPSADPRSLQHYHIQPPHPTKVTAKGLPVNGAMAAIVGCRDQKKGNDEGPCGDVERDRKT